MILNFVGFEFIYLNLFVIRVFSWIAHLIKSYLDISHSTIHFIWV